MAGETLQLGDRVRTTNGLSGIIRELFDDPGHQTAYVALHASRRVVATSTSASSRRCQPKRARQISIAGVRLYIPKELEADKAHNASGSGPAGRRPPDERHAIATRNDRATRIRRF